jgi:hypothetical protein
MNGGRVRKGIALLTVVVALALALFGQPAVAGTAEHLNGGGAASVGQTAFSQVAFNVSIDAAGTASGSFECLMAGRSVGVLAPFRLAHNMMVHATPTSGSVNGPIVTFTGPARLTLDGSTKMNVDVQVWVDVATQQFQLTVVDLGLTMDVETLTSGRISMS